MVGERQNLAGEVMTVLPFYPDTTFHNYFNVSSVYCLNKEDLKLAFKTFNLI